LTSLLLAFSLLFFTLSPPNPARGLGESCLRLQTHFDAFTALKTQLVLTSASYVGVGYCSSVSVSGNSGSASSSVVVVVVVVMKVEVVVEYF